MWQLQRELFCIMTWFSTAGTYTLIGLLLGVGFVVPVLWWMVFFGVALMLLQLSVPRPRQWTWVWYAFGIKYLLALWWFWSVYPIDWLGITLGNFELIAIGFYWITAAVWLGAGAYFFVRVFQFLHSRNESLAILAVPFLWLATELGGALVFSIVTYGPGASIGTQFSFGFVGYLAAQHGLLLSLAAVWGVYGLTIMMVGIAAAGFYLVTINQHLIAFGLFLLVVLTSFFSSSVTTNPNDVPGYRIAVIDTTVAADYSLTAGGLEEKERQQTAAYNAAKSLAVDYIIFPEDSRVFDHTRGTATLAVLLAFESEADDPIVLDSSRVPAVGGGVLQAAWFNPKTEVVTAAHKSYLVPQGEFMPSAYYHALRVVGMGDIASDLQRRISFVIGDAVSQDKFPKNIPAVLFCFEGVDPNGIRNIIKNRSTETPFVAHIISHAWFNDPVTLWSQLEAKLQVQAVWNNTYVVVSANQANGYVVDPKGNVVFNSPSLQGDGWSVTEVVVPAP